VESLQSSSRNELPSSRAKHLHKPGPSLLMRVIAPRGHQSSALETVSGCGRPTLKFTSFETGWQDSQPVLLGLGGQPRLGTVAHVSLHAQPATMCLSAYLSSMLDVAGSL